MRVRGSCRFRVGVAAVAAALVVMLWGVEFSRLRHVDARPRTVGGAPVGSRETTGATGSCMCGLDCTDVVCNRTAAAVDEGPRGDRAASGGAVGISLVFAPCARCTTSGAREKCASTRAGPAKAQLARCGDPGGKLSRRVKRCVKGMDGNVPGRPAFALVASGGLLLAATLGGTDEGRRITQADVVVAAARKLQDALAARRQDDGDASGAPPFRFVDVGMCDVKLDVQLAGVPLVLDTADADSGARPASHSDSDGAAKLFTVEAFPLTNALRHLSHVTGCLSGAANFARRELIGRPFQLPREWATSDAFVAREEYIPAGRPMVLRIAAPGYDGVLHELLREALVGPEGAPVMVLLHPPPAATAEQNAINASLAGLLLRHGFIAHNFRTCHSADSVTSLWRLRAESLVVHGDLVVWVREDYAHVYRPRCLGTCMEVRCSDSGRTEFKPCGHAVECGAVDAGGCGWKTVFAPCRSDRHLALKARSCELGQDPSLPSFSLASTAALHNLLVACPGGDDCAAAEVASASGTVDLLAELAQPLRQQVGGIATVVDVGAGSGLVAHALLHRGFAVAHLFDALPHVRQLLRVVHCVSGVTGVHVHDEAVGAEDKMCWLDPDEESMAGRRLDFQCKPHPRNATFVKRHHVAQQFAKLDTIFSSQLAQQRLERRWAPLLRLNAGAATAQILLQGAKQWLCAANAQPILVALHLGEVGDLDEHDGALLFDFMRSCAFTEIVVIPAAIELNAAASVHPQSAAEFAQALREPTAAIIFSLARPPPFTSTAAS